MREALIGAAYLDKRLATAKQFILTQSRPT
jgi:dsRNA-specific ribonuclease